MKRKLFLMIILGMMTILCACSAQRVSTSGDKNISGLEYEGSMKLKYAQQFAVDYYKGGYALISIKDGDRFLVIPEDKDVPENMDSDIKIIKRPLKNVYMVSTSAMDLVCAIDEEKNIRLSGTKEKDWYVDKAKEAMKSGNMLYAGKYSAPDYELILSEKCELAVENTMIYHSPEVIDKLENTGVPVLVEKSSYESHPLGRMEWIKMYGVLFGKEDEAEKYFDEKTKEADKVIENVEKEQNDNRKTVAFFYITSNGAVSVRKSGDYVSKMIELAGGEYVFKDLTDENALSTMNIQMEEFYAIAKDADYLIYNSAIDGELYTMDELIEKSSMLKDFKAVKNGDVWCTGKNMFQETTGIADMIVDINSIVNGADGDLEYIHKLTE